MRKRIKIVSPLPCQDASKIDMQRNATHLLITDLNPSVVISVKLSERICQGLDGNWSLDEIVKSDISSAWTRRSYKQWVRKSGESRRGARQWEQTKQNKVVNKNRKNRKKVRPVNSRIARTIFIVFLNQQIDKLVREIVTKGAESGSHLVAINASRTVSVKGLETLLPIFNVFPEASEFIKVNGTSVV